MSKRFAMSRKQSKRNFRRGTGTHKRNLAMPMRGGIRA